MLVTGAEQLWGQCAGALRTELPDAVWKAWLAPVRPLSVDDDQFVLGVPGQVHKDRIEARYKGLITDVVSEVAGRTRRIVLEVQTDAEVEAFPAVGEGPSTQGVDVPLNPAYTFESFVVADNNAFAQAAALSVAEEPGKSWNPLFIHGSTGLGKTHLLHAIGHLVRQTNPGLLVRYVSTELFLSDFIDAIRTNAMPAFKNRYRHCGVLLIDDVQLIEGKERFQQEFFHTFDYLRASGRQVVISSDRPPKALATLEERLISRFSQGLITDVTPPQLETRVAILHKKAESEKVSVPADVFDYIAGAITDNIRQLEGALNRVLAYASLYRCPLDRQLAEKVLADLISAGQPKPVTPQAVLDATAEMFGLTVEDLCGKSRSRPLVTARQIAMYVLRQTTTFSYPAIGKVFGNRDHTTVMHAVSKIEGRMRERRAIFDQVNELTNRLKGGGQAGGNA